MRRGTPGCFDGGRPLAASPLVEIFWGHLDQATTYEEYVRTLDRATSRLEAPERGGMLRCGGQSLTDHFA